MVALLSETANRNLPDIFPKRWNSTTITKENNTQYAILAKKKFHSEAAESTLRAFDFRLSLIVGEL